LDEILSANAEQEDIEARQNNIILYRVAESSQSRTEERLKEDVNFCEKFLLALRVGVDPENIIKVLRLGKRNTDGASPRPILIQLGSRRVKNRISLQDKVFGSVYALPRNNLGQVVYMHVPLSTKQYKLVPASAGT